MKLYRIQTIGLPFSVSVNGVTLTSEERLMRLSPDDLRAIHDYAKRKSVKVDRENGTTYLVPADPDLEPLAARIILAPATSGPERAVPIAEESWTPATES